ncbi:hypothetical protein [Primorskyibacter flagellatus]|uniref:hypothetical protein n=1 Tax=Primorskyibacter flagellatus TaxID=1387277 RepID=UPI000A02BAE7|nr:hypothetical protein [Primorskyibacter flagellatus]
MTSLIFVGGSYVLSYASKIRLGGEILVGEDLTPSVRLPSISCAGQAFAPSSRAEAITVIRVRNPGSLRLGAQRVELMAR